MRFGAPIPALSINQPWAGLIAVGLKDIENRSWRTRHRGPLLIHAGIKADRDAMQDVMAGRHPVTGDPLDRGAIQAATERGAFALGGIVGQVRIIECVSRSSSSWFVGPYGFVLAHAELTPLRPCVGALGLFTPDFSSRYAPKRALAGTAPVAHTAAPVRNTAPAAPSTLPLFPEEIPPMLTTDNRSSREQSSAVLGGGDRA